MTTHTFYKAVFDHPEYGVVLTWHDTHFGASRATFPMPMGYALPVDQVMEVLVPTEKADLLKWLNENCTAEV